MMRSAAAARAVTLSHPPFIPGLEACGEVVEVAEDVTGCQPGQRVVVRMRPGAFAEEVVVPAETLLPAPSTLSDLEAAAFMVGYRTAYHCLLDRGALRFHDGPQAIHHRAEIAFDNIAHALAPSRSS